MAATQDDLLCRSHLLVLPMAAELAHSRWDAMTLSTVGTGGNAGVDDDVPDQRLDLAAAPSDHCRVGESAPPSGGGGGALTLSVGSYPMWTMPASRVALSSAGLGKKTELTMNDADRFRRLLRIEPVAALAVDAGPAQLRSVLWDRWLPPLALDPAHAH